MGKKKRRRPKKEKPHKRSLAELILKTLEEIAIAVVSGVLTELLIKRLFDSK